MRNRAFCSLIQAFFAAGAGEVTELPTWTIHNMQDMNSTICTNAEMHTTGQLTDLRDGKQYWVTKLKDGNCWMTQNLDYNGGGTKIEIAEEKDGRYTLDGWQHDSSIAQYVDVGEKIILNNQIVNAPANVDRHFLVGNYYSWLAATNGSGAETALGENALDSVCPDGWMLPTYAGNNSYQNLLSDIPAKPIDTALDSPYYFVMAGTASSGASGLSYTYSGRYWTSTRHLSTNLDNQAYAFYGYVLVIDVTGGIQPIYSGDSNWGGYGSSVRCVAE